MKTTVPFKIERYRHVLYQGVQPIFSQIPTKEDFNYAISQVDFKGEKRVLLDFEILKITISRSRDGNKYYLFHEKSLDDWWTNYLIGDYFSYETAILEVKRIIGNEVTKLNSLTRYLERAIA